jgi:ribosomal protein L37AE/L43A
VRTRATQPRFGNYVAGVTSARSEEEVVRSFTSSSTHRLPSRRPLRLTRRGLRLRVGWAIWKCSPCSSRHHCGAISPRREVSKCVVHRHGSRCDRAPNVTSAFMRQNVREGRERLRVPPTS